MVFRIVVLVLAFYSNFIIAEPLNTLLTSIASPSPAASSPVTPSPVTPSPVIPSPVIPSPVIPEPVISSPVTPSPVIPSPVMPSPVIPSPVIPSPVTPEPIVPEPIIPKAIVPSPVIPSPVIPAPVIPRPVMPGVVVNPAVAPQTAFTGVQATVGAPKFVGAAAPAVATTVEMTLSDVHQVSDKGLDTLSVDTGGNWLEKRAWYQKAEQQFEEIRVSVQKASDIRMKFVHAVNDAGHTIDAFYQNINFQKGHIDELLQTVGSELAMSKKVRGGDLSPDERDVRLKIQADEKVLQAITAHFKAVEDLDDQIDKTMMKAFKEIDACRALETKAWNNFKDIGLELDDKKARVLYFEMENFAKNIDQKMQYLQGNLLQYLQNQLVSKVQEVIGQIQESMKDLSTKGMALDQILKKNEQNDFVILQDRDTAKAAQAAKDQEKLQEQQQAKSAKPKKAKAETWYQQWLDVVLDYTAVAVEKLSDWLMIVMCCVQTIMCNIRDFICQFFGK